MANGVQRLSRPQPGAIQIIKRIAKAAKDMVRGAECADRIACGATAVCDSLHCTWRVISNLRIASSDWYSDDSRSSTDVGDCCACEPTVGRHGTVVAEHGRDKRGSVGGEQRRKAIENLRASRRAWTRERSAAMRLGLRAQL